MSIEWDITLILTITGVVCGVIGAVLGAIKTWNQLQINKVRLKVTPQHAIPVGSLEGAPINFSIDVINLSEFPVTITDVGFTLAGNRKATLATLNRIQQPSDLPVRLEQRTTYSVWFELSTDDPNTKYFLSAYAHTQCGETVTGTSDALKQAVKG